MEMTICNLPAGWQVYERSIQKKGSTVFCVVRGSDGEKELYVQGEARFSGGKPLAEGNLYRLTPQTAHDLAQVFPWLTAQRIPVDRPSFGFGDRLGLATPGHIMSLGKTNVFPILAQQSVRENSRTGRTFAEVLASVIFGAFQEGYNGGFGADADHLKRVEDALEAAEIGYTFFTCDPSEHVVGVEKLGDEELRQRFSALNRADEWRQEYLDRPFPIAKLGELRFTEDALLRAAVKYGNAIEFAVEMYRALTERLPHGFDYEVSVDETDFPTSPLEHLFVARELRRRGVEFVSLAPRFVGAMEKGVDWRGDLDQFKQELHAHAAIARDMGSYRLSLHSGSDKFTLYPLLHAQTHGCWHVKTAGTSYLVALDVVARNDPSFFREIMQLSLSAFAADKQSYHISADPARISPLDTVSDDNLAQLVAKHDSRQVLHVGFGSVLSQLGDRLNVFLASYEQEHYAGLAHHLGRHLQGLEVSNERI
jgi:rubrerythrin